MEPKSDIDRAYLVREIQRVKAQLLHEPVPDSLASDGPTPGLVLLQRLFELSAFEHDVIAMCAGAALEPTLAAALRGGRPTFGQALASFAGAHLDAASPSAPLRAHRLVAATPGDHLSSPLVIDERILHFILGIDAVDERIAPVLNTTRVEVDVLASSHRAVAERVAALLESRTPMAIVVTAASPADRIATVLAALEHVESRPLRVRASSLALPPNELDALLHACERESILDGAVPVVELDPFDGPEAERGARTFVERARCFVIVSAAAPLALSRLSLRFELPWPDAHERHALWLELFGPRGVRLGAALPTIAQQFRIDAATIRSAVAACDPASSDEQLAEELWTACRQQSRPLIDDLAQRIEPVAGWDDLVLPPAVVTVLRDIGHHLRFRHEVHDRWGFARGDARGQAITAMFCGPSGTGKTLAAEVIARDAKLDLYRIDLSQVVDKYVGETEKRLRRIFDAAEQGGAILLFDEADALFGKRGEVERATDRWANLEVSYLLQRMECYRGLAILTTNAKDALDNAFLRRLRFVARFPFPDVKLRTELWQRAFPLDAPTSGLEPARLAQLQLTGANIKTVALKSAFHAATERTPITMTHVLRAARNEFAKLEIPFPEAEARTWFRRAAE